jgi:hypothetical protein
MDRNMEKHWWSDRATGVWVRGGGHARSVVEAGGGASGGEGVAVVLGDGLTSAVAAAPHNRVMVKILVIGFIVDEVRWFQGGGWPDGWWRGGLLGHKRCRRGNRTRGGPQAESRVRDPSRVRARRLGRKRCRRGNRTRGGPQAESRVCDPRVRVAPLACCGRVNWFSLVQSRPLISVNDFNAD